ncbi:MAG: hypothetical protein A3J75_02615 [Acidobacteria bacterium RBG_16_68_9]|nr:MAG: hypothetical protein A3J75_02615 [Acidobacteria bacterium RBG_16_68_9]
MSNTVGFDDAPFARAHRGQVRIVGAVFADLRFDGVLIGAVEKDGSDATDELVRLVRSSRFAEHVRLVLLQGIAFAGFNVVDVEGVHRRLGLPVLVVARRRPDLEAIEAALRARVPGGTEKWALIRSAGPMESVGGVFVQRAGLSLEQAEAVVSRLAVHGRIPEPLRVAHLIAGALADGESRGRS